MAAKGPNDYLRLEQGYHVTFYDFRSLSLEFLVWRLQQRNWSAEVVFAGEEKEVPGFDSLWLMDVIEHLPNPQASLGPLLQRCRLLVYETDYSGTSGGRHPFHFQHSEADFRMFFQHMGFVEDCSSSAVNVWYRP